MYANNTAINHSYNIRLKKTMNVIAPIYNKRYYGKRCINRVTTHFEKY